MAWVSRKSFHGFSNEKDSLIFCNDISGLLDEYGIKFNSANWRCFIDSSKRSLKGVLLHNGNRYASIPIVYSVSEGVVHQHKFDFSVNMI